MNKLLTILLVLSLTTELALYLAYERDRRAVKPSEAVSKDYPTRYWGIESYTYDQLPSESGVSFGPKGRQKTWINWPTENPAETNLCIVTEVQPYFAHRPDPSRDIWIICFKTNAGTSADIKILK